MWAELELLGWRGNKAMKKQITMIISLLMAGILFCTGCAEQQVDYKGILLDYLNNRYPDDTFTLSPNQLTTERNTKDSYFFFFRSEKFPGKSIVACRDKVDGQYRFDDNYLKYYLQDDIENYMHDIAEKSFGECKVFVRFSNYFQTLPESFPTDATAEDYMMVGQPCLFDVVLPPEQITLEEAREALEPFKSELEKRGFEKMTLGIYILPDNESYEEAEWIYGSMDYFKDPKWVGGISVSE